MLTTAKPYAVMLKLQFDHKHSVNQEVMAYRYWCSGRKCTLRSEQITQQGKSKDRYRCTEEHSNSRRDQVCHFGWTRINWRNFFLSREFERRCGGHWPTFCWLRDLAELLESLPWMQTTLPEVVWSLGQPDLLAATNSPPSLKSLHRWNLSSALWIMMKAESNAYTSPTHKDSCRIDSWRNILLYNGTAVIANNARINICGGIRLSNKSIKLQPELMQKEGTKACKFPSAWDQSSENTCTLICKSVFSLHCKSYTRNQREERCSAYIQKIASSLQTVKK